MISIENISVRVGEVTILDGITTTFQQGKINLIIGPNGAGKSTLVKVVSGQMTPSTGHVFYNSANLRDLAGTALSRFRAVLSQNIYLAFPLKVWEVVMMGRYPHFAGKPGARDEQAVEEAMDLFDIQGMKDRNYITLSGGEKQRVHFARVVSQLWFPLESGNRYLMLDEPLTFLDVHYQFEFMKKLQTLLANQDMVIIGVVHDLNLAARFGDRILLLEGGRVLADGDKKDVLTRENILKAFRLEPVIVQNERTGSINLFFE
jgi:iron complex transport system ATP-binding protein